ncbi:protein ENHANCED PSEUDOMONAS SUSCEPTIBILITY 1-like [Gastrolobium bilobum]|uniref:protein ENHANCED PSEUDOMONAS SUSCEPTIBILITY 1-like n=1 Tax=Gastrolobium bilobum TaxID=150636 RepID=UPI002AAFEC12|nr:protein ENHANCED PSEUDOMONAS SUSCEPTIBILITY 1-like [Gastrolobium bilobum]
MGAIRVISTNRIQAPSHNNGDTTQILNLTPWDLQLLHVETIQKGLLFHNPNNTQDTQIQIQNLKHSLSSTLAFFPLLTGRLIITEHKDNTASAYIACNNVGALFVHATAEKTSVADILKPNYVPPIVHSFFQLNEMKNNEGTSQPLLAVQVTELVDGIFMACTINHLVADGKSFWHFINSWAEISRGSHNVSKLPQLDRCFNSPIRFPFTKQEEKQNPENFKRQAPPVRIFHFTKEKIAQLKSKANAEARTDKISSLQALLTHLWRFVIRCQRRDPQEEIHYDVVISARIRMVPPMPEDYFGNASVVGRVTMKAGELLEGGLAKGAWEINKMIASYSEEKVKSQCESWVKNPRFIVSVGSSNRLITASSPRFNVYSNDFGSGIPVAVRSGSANQKYGNITVIGGAERGSVDIEACLPYEILEAMGNDPEFMNATSKL